MQLFPSVGALLEAVERGEAHRGDTVYVDAQRYAALPYHERATLWRVLRGRGVHLVTEAWIGEQAILRRRGERFLYEG